MEWLYSLTASTGATSIQAALLALFMWCLHRQRQTNRFLRWQYLLGILLLARLCLPTTPSLSYHPFNWFSKSTAIESGLSTTAAPPLHSSFDAITKVEPTSLEPLPLAGNAQTVQATAFSRPWHSYLAVLWLIGLSICIGKMFVSYHRHRMLLRSCRPLQNKELQTIVEQLAQQLKLNYPVALLKSEHISSAAVTGTWHPKLIVSSRFFNDLNSEQRRHILVHELVHLQRCDPLVNWLSSLLQSLHWFNPLVRWALRQFQHDRELICDAAAIRILGESHRRAYGETLIQVLASFRQHRSFPNLVPIISNKQEIKRRMIMITSNQRNNTRRPLLLAAGLAAVLTLAFTRPAHVQAQSGKGKQESSPENQLPKVIGEANVEFHYTTEEPASSHKTIRLRDLNSRGSGAGVLVAPGHGKQRYTLHDIDVTEFESGGILVIDLEVGDGESAGSFDLFPPNVPLPKNDPQGAVASAYDVAPGSSRTIVHSFDKGQTFRFGATGNWFSEEGATNEFSFVARAIHHPHGSHGISATLAQPTVSLNSSNTQEGIPVIVKSTSGKPTKLITIDQGKAKVINFVPNSDIAVIAYPNDGDSEPKVVKVQSTVALIGTDDHKEQLPKLKISSDKTTAKGVTVYYDFDPKKTESSDSKVSN